MMMIWFLAINVGLLVGTVAAPPFLSRNDFDLLHARNLINLVNMMRLHALTNACETRVDCQDGELLVWVGRERWSTQVMPSYCQWFGVSGGVRFSKDGLMRFNSGHFVIGGVEVVVSPFARTRLRSV